MGVGWVGGWVAALSLHRVRMLSTHQSLFANHPVACAALTPPPTYETLIADVLTFFEIARRLVGLVCIGRCLAAPPWWCVSGTVVRGLFPTKSPLLNFTIASTENSATLITPRMCNINKTSPAFYVNYFNNVGVAGRPAEGVSKVGLQSYCVHASVATAFRRRLLSCKLAVLLEMCPQVVGKSDMYPNKNVFQFG